MEGFGGGKDEGVMKMGQEKRVPGMVVLGKGTEKSGRMGGRKPLIMIT